MIRTLGVSQFLVIIVITVALIFAWDFGRRILETAALVQTAQATDERLNQLEQVNAQLTTLKQDVTQAEWLEKQARTRLHYAKEGETLFIPISTPPAPPTSAPIVMPAPPARTLWDDILEALFGPVLE